MGVSFFPVRQFSVCEIGSTFMRIKTYLPSILILMLFAVVAKAEEPTIEFVEGLRNRGYYDSALQYLEIAESQPGIPDDVKKLIPYERAQTLLKSAKNLSNLELQRKQLDASQASFEAFVKASPGHRLAGQANTARGRILLEKARVDIWDGDKPSNEASRETFRDSARTAIGQAQRIFQQANDQHKKNWEKYPTYIPEDEVAKRAERAQAENLYMEAQLDLAQCNYWLAQTYNKGEEKRKKLLTDTAFEFEEIHKKYRSQVGGLFARMWQAKCFEEQDEIRIALGIYEELLGHEGEKGAIRALKDRALRFRMICLNHDKRKDYQLVIDEGEDWLKNAKARSRTDVGLGIQWELSRAHEAIGTDRTVAEPLRKNHLTQALGRARSINRYPGELKTPSSAMIQRIMVALNREPGDPKDFETAYGNGGQLYDEVVKINQQLREMIAARKMKEAKQLQETLIVTAGEMARMYSVSLKLIRDETDPRLINLARLRLSYSYLLQERFFDSAVVARYQMVKYGEEFPEVSSEAGFLAMTAYDHAYTRADENDREFEASMVTQIAEELAERWPDSGRANDARNTVAKIHWNNDDRLGAAEWWAKIPDSADQYPDAQVRIGKAYWRQYVIEASKPEETRASAEDLTKWKAEAVTHLERGLAEFEKITPADKALPDEVVGAKLTLVNIRNLDGVYKQKEGGPLGALELLTSDPHSVIKAVEVAEGQARPSEPGNAKSRQMASFAFQQLLRAQIGLKNLEEARKARKQLEAVAAGEDDAALTQVFIDFGKELQQELERLNATGEAQRLEEVRSGFEAFLGDLFNRKEGQTFYSLLWIAETYASLADGSGDNPSKAEEFYVKASEAYESILERAETELAFTSDPRQIIACKLRLVNTLRRQRNYAEAEKYVLEILKENPNAPDAQFEAARLYQAWGGSEGADSWQKYEIALSGKKEPAHVWGWNYTAQSLQRATYGKPDERLDQLHVDARYNLAVAEREFGKAHPNLDEGTKHLDRARTSIVGFHAISNRWPDEQYEKFNALYRKILGDLGSPVVDLPRDPTGGVGGGGGDAGGGGGDEPPVTNVAVANPEVKEDPPAKSNMLLIAALLGAGIAAVGGLYFMSVGASKKKYAEYAGKKSTAMSKDAEPIQIALPPAPEPQVKSSGKKAASQAQARDKAQAAAKAKAQAEAKMKAQLIAKKKLAAKKAAAQKAAEAGNEGEVPKKRVKKRPPADGTVRRKKRPPKPEE